MCEWQIVTVAFACSRRCAIGLPTMSLRPITTARAPSISILCSRSISITPTGVAPTSVGLAEEELPGVERMQPVDVLGRGDRAQDPRSRRCEPGSGSWTRIASIASSAFSAATLASSSSSLVSAGSRTSRRVEAGFERGLVLEPDVHLGGGVVADEHGHEPDVADRLHLLGDLGADALGDRFPLDQRR